MPPVVIGAGIAAAGAVGAAAIGSKGASKAAQAQSESNAQSVALQRDVYNQNAATLSPFIQRGNAAGNSINALLGLGGTQQQSIPTPQPNALSQYQGAQPDTSRLGVAQYKSPINNEGFGYTVPGGYFLNRDGTMRTATQQTQQPPTQTPQQAANNAFDIYKNSTGYQFRLGQGLNAVNSGYAGAGTLQSGAALKAINEYGQNFASNEFGNYMGYLGNQQGVGLSAASAQAGVGQNYANSVSNLNSANANALGQLQIAKANNTAGLIGGLGQIGGYVAGNILAPGGNASYAPGMGTIVNTSSAWR